MKGGSDVKLVKEGFVVASGCVLISDSMVCDQGEGKERKVLYCTSFFNQSCHPENEASCLLKLFFAWFFRFLTPHICIYIHSLII